MSSIAEYVLGGGNEAFARILGAKLRKIGDILAKFFEIERAFVIDPGLPTAEPTACNRQFFVGSALEGGALDGRDLYCVPGWFGWLVAAILLGRGQEPDLGL